MPLNDLPQGLCNSLIGYADNYNVLPMKPEKLENGLAKLSKWCCRVKLKLSLSKYHYPAFKNALTEQTKELVKNYILEQLETVKKNLGIVISTNISWTKHVKIRSRKAIGSVFSSSAIFF